MRWLTKAGGRLGRRTKLRQWLVTNLVDGAKSHWDWADGSVLAVGWNSSASHDKLVGCKGRRHGRLGL